MAIGRGATGAATGIAGAADFAAGGVAAGFLITGFFLAALLRAGLRAGFFFFALMRLALLRAAPFLTGLRVVTFLFFFEAFRAAFFFAFAMCTSVGTR
jgi:hypothetical protein